MKLIESFSVKKYDKFYLLTINTTKKWLSYHRFNDNVYCIEEYQEDDFIGKEDLFIDDFLPKDRQYIRFDNQDKHQIIFLFLDRDNIVIKGTKQAKWLGKDLEVKRFNNYQEYIKTIESKFNEKK